MRGVGGFLTADYPKPRQAVPGVGAILAAEGTPMPDRPPDHRDEVLWATARPEVVTDLPGGGVMVVRGGVVGLGWSHDEAASDWRQNLLEMIARPKHPPPFPAGDTEIDTLLDSPTGEHPPVS
jgi:hypothetical protein